MNHLAGSKHIRLAFVMGIVCCLLGLGFCLVQGPSSRAASYMDLASEALASQRPDAAAASALMAVRYAPSNIHGWQVLAQTLEQDGQRVAARQAERIARHLQQNPSADMPLYALPAELKLSLLAIDQTVTP